MAEERRLSTLVIVTQWSSARTRRASSAYCMRDVRRVEDDGLDRRPGPGVAVSARAAQGYSASLWMPSLSTSSVAQLQTRGGSTVARPASGPGHRCEPQVGQSGRASAAGSQCNWPGNRSNGSGAPRSSRKPIIAQSCRMTCS
jgi:hypothetical protein